MFPAASIPIFPGILRWNGQDREPILSAMSGGEFSCGPNVTIATIRPRRADGFIDGRNKSLGSLQPLHTSESSSRRLPSSLCMYGDRHRTQFSAQFTPARSNSTSSVAV